MTDLKAGTKVILVNDLIGYVQATLKQDYSSVGGGSAIHSVYVNSKSLPGITEMQINVNRWEVYDADDIDILRRIRDLYIPRDLVR